MVGISFEGNVFHLGRKIAGSRMHIHHHGAHRRNLTGHACRCSLVMMQKKCHQKGVYFHYTTPSPGEVMTGVATVQDLVKCSIQNEGSGLLVWEFDSFLECCVVLLNSPLSCGASCFSLRSCADSCSSLFLLGSLSGGGVASSSCDCDSQSDYGCGFYVFACSDLSPCSFSDASFPPH